MYGACFGDAAGAPFEYAAAVTGKPIDEAKLKDLTASDRDGTDDTVMTAAVANALTRYAGMDHALIEYPDWRDRFSSELVDDMVRLGREHIRIGYGGKFLQWLMGDDHSPYESWGNGSAMRVSPVGWFADTTDEAASLAKLTADVTHNSTEGERGAIAIAVAVRTALDHRGNPDGKTAIREAVERYVNDGNENGRGDGSPVRYDLTRTTDDIIRAGYRFEVSCQYSVPEAICAFLDPASTDYESTVRNAIRLNGDTDTQAAMAGGIAEAYYGIPDRILADEHRRLARLGLGTIADRFRDVVMDGATRANA